MKKMRVFVLFTLPIIFSLFAFNASALEVENESVTDNASPTSAEQIESNTGSGAYGASDNNASTSGVDSKSATGNTNLSSIGEAGSNTGLCASTADTPNKSTSAAGANSAPVSDSANGKVVENTNTDSGSAANSGTSNGVSSSNSNDEKNDSGDKVFPSGGTNSNSSNANTKGTNELAADKKDASETNVNEAGNTKGANGSAANGKDAKGLVDNETNNNDQLVTNGTRNVKNINETATNEAGNETNESDTNELRNAKSPTLEADGEGDMGQVVYHVIFKYGDNLSHIDGGGTINLSTLLDSLNLNLQISNIEMVATSNSGIISITEIENDVEIKSESVFTSNEMLTITMVNEAEYVINVNSDIPEHTKVLTDNGNGTFQIALSVKGAAVIPTDPPHANVIIVYDTSGSMSNEVYIETIDNNNTTSTQYRKNDDGTYSRIYWRNNAWRETNSNNGVVYNGVRYKVSGTRSAAANDAISDLVDELLQYNTETHPNVVEIAVVNFSTGVNSVLNPSTDSTAVLNAISRTPGGGTNWEAALKSALDISVDADKTYVIFVSDGNPTYRDTADNAEDLPVTDNPQWYSTNYWGEIQPNNYYNSYRDDKRDDRTQYGLGSDDPSNVNYSATSMNRSYNNATDEAKALVDKGYDFYTVGIYGDVDRMKDLTVAAGKTEDNYYSAEDTDALAQAFSEIIGKIFKAMGVAEVEVDDGTTNRAELSSGTVTKLLEVDENSYTYWMSKEVDVYPGDEYEYYTTRIDRTNGQVFEVYVTDADPTDDKVTITYTRPSNNERFSGAVTGYVKNNILTVQWKKDEGALSPDLFFGQKPADAYLDERTGAVVWKMTDSDEPLLDGVTYTIKFDVWKTQQVFDLIADLKNGIIKYEWFESLSETKYQELLDEIEMLQNLENPTDEQKQQLEVDLRKKELAGLDEYIIRTGDEGNYGYTLRTNTDAKLTYFDTRVGDEQESTNYTNPEGIVIVEQNVALSKEWVNVLDKREGGDVTLVLYRQIVSNQDTSGMTEEELKEYNEAHEAKEYLEIELTKDNDWKVEGVAISPGLMTIKYRYIVNENGREKMVAEPEDVDIKDPGYDYFMMEKGSDVHNWQLVAETIHPMVINGVLTELIKMDPNATNTFVVDGGSLESYYIPAEFSDPSMMFVTSNRGHHFLRLVEGGDVYFINEVREIDFVANMAQWPEIPNEKFAVPNNRVKVDVVDNLGNHYDEFYIEYDENATDEDEKIKFYLHENDTNSVKVYSYFEKNNEYLVKYGPLGGAIYYHVEVEPWIDVDLLNDEEKVQYNRILSAFSNSYLSYYRENINISPEIALVNYRRSNLNINKVVSGDAPKDTVYTFDINIYDPGNVKTGEDGTIVLDYLWFSVYDSETGGYVDFGEIEGWTKEEGATWSGYYYGENREDTMLTIGLKESYNLRFANLTTQAVFTVKEHDIEKFVYVGAIGSYEQTIVLDGDRMNANTVIVTTEGDSVTIDGERIWCDINDVPEEVVLVIYEVEKQNDGTVTSETEVKRVTVSPASRTTSGGETEYYAAYVFEDLDTGKTYMIKESADGGEFDEIGTIEKDSYVITEEKDREASGGITLTNSNYYVSMENSYEVAKASVEKKWADGDDYDSIRPASIYVQLYKDGVANGVALLNADNGWKYTWTDLVRFDTNGREIVYTVNEVKLDGENYVIYVPEGYTANIAGGQTEGESNYVITNTHIPYKTVTVIKSWNDANNQDGKRPSSINVTLSTGDTVVLNAGNSWTGSVSNLPVFDSEWKEITYTWTEADIDGYTLTGNSTVNGVTTLTNTHTPATTSKTVVKVWADNNDQDGKRPGSITVTLSNGTNVVLNAGNNWTATVNDLPVYANGQEISYTWTEAGIDGYTLTGNSTVNNITTLTNTHTPVAPGGSTPEEPEDPTSDEPEDSTPKQPKSPTSEEPKTPTSEQPKDPESSNVLKKLEFSENIRKSKSPKGPNIVNPFTASNEINDIVMASVGLIGFAFCVFYVGRSLVSKENKN